jgi:hypothetical protein
MRPGVLDETSAAPLPEEIRSVINGLCLHRQPFTHTAPARPDL